ncbi:hypothetical protein [Caulobacter sp. 17J80-11]|uniref:hypothetical protein n=1 Tax=Caulobacter sp. 17J80-11 TaxID=2763502 RepID=UPI0016536678|nr:hypothetical protein [Caulobacter sp. 17J80-11]MBC6983258.1 hypothetical protein [Caulobacter sp. 17J80-11]
MRDVATEARFGLSLEEFEYARELAFHAGAGAWATNRSIVERSKALLDGRVTDQNELKELLTELLRLAAYDPDHEWEAPILTGQPTQFAVAAFQKISDRHA